MNPENIDVYRINYDKKEWERITQGWRLHIAPAASILAVNALCDDVERLHAAITESLLMFDNWPEGAKAVLEDAIK